MRGQCGIYGGPEKCRQIQAPVGFKPTISAGEEPQTYALDRAATGTGSIMSRQALE